MKISESYVIYNSRNFSRNSLGVGWGVNRWAIEGAGYLVLLKKCISRLNFKQLRLTSTMIPLCESHTNTLWYQEKLLPVPLSQRYRSLSFHILPWLRGSNLKVNSYMEFTWLSQYVPKCANVPWFVLRQIFEKDKS